MIQRGKQGNFGERGAISLSMLVLDFEKILLLVFYFSLKIILLFLTIRFLYLFFFFFEWKMIYETCHIFLRSKFWYEGSHWWGRLLFLSSETCYLESIVHAGWIKKKKNLQNFLVERKFHIFFYCLDTFRVEQWFRWFLFAPFNIFLEFLENL